MSAFSVEKSILEKWQNLVDTLAELVDVPVALIMRQDEEDIEVFVSSDSDGNPYRPGDRERLPGSGLYCEKVICSRKRLHVPDALKDKKWINNPDIKLGMISYLGFPILLPSGEVFGTICVLDSEEKHFSSLQERLMLQYKDLIETHLLMIRNNLVLRETNEELARKTEEIKTLQGILPICSICKKIKDDEGYWKDVEEYLHKHMDAKFTHGLCLDCLKEHYPEQYMLHQAQFDSMDKS